MKRCAAVCVLGLLVSTMPAGDTKAYKQTIDEIKIFALTNYERKQKDLEPLKLSSELSKVARAHSENMARQGKMEHVLDDKKPDDRIRAAGYKFSTMGENIAMADDGATLPAIMKLWMDSKGHRENILQPAFTEIGVGIARDKNGVMYFTQVFATPRK